VVILVLFLAFEIKTTRHPKHTKRDATVKHAQKKEEVIQHVAEPKIEERIVYVPKVEVKEVIKHVPKIEYREKIVHRHVPVAQPVQVVQQPVQLVQQPVQLVQQQVVQQPVVLAALRASPTSRCPWS